MIILLQVKFILKTAVGARLIPKVLLLLLEAGFIYDVIYASDMLHSQG